jgi:3-phytase
LFLGVEAEGVRVVEADRNGSTEIRIIADVDQIILAADVEGMSLYKQGAAGYLIVSSQGNYSYSVYDRVSPHAYRGSFYIGVNESQGIDGAEETDGLDASSVLRTAAFPAGLLVVQDGFNTLPNAPQNFKYVSWQDIADALEL